MMWKFLILFLAVYFVTGLGISLCRYPVNCRCFQRQINCFGNRKVTSLPDLSESKWNELIFKNTTLTNLKCSLLPQFLEILDVRATRMTSTKICALKQTCEILKKPEITFLFDSNVRCKSVHVSTTQYTPHDNDTVIYATVISAVCIVLFVCIGLMLLWHKKVKHHRLEMRNQVRLMFGEQERNWERETEIFYDCVDPGIPLRVVPQDYIPLFH